MSVATVKKPPRTKFYMIIAIMVLFLIGSIYQTDATLTRLATGTPEILKFIAEMFPPDWLFFADIWKPMAQTHTNVHSWYGHWSLVRVPDGAAGCS